MTLKDACEIAEDCGLETIGEAVDNIDIHCTSIFCYSDIPQELQELHLEASEYDWNMSIKEFLERC